MGHTGQHKVDALSLVAGRVLRTRERTVATYVALSVVQIEIEHDAEPAEQLSLALPMLPPRVRVAPLPALAAPIAPDAEAITLEALATVARAERAERPTVRPGRRFEAEVVGAESRRVA